MSATNGESQRIRRVKTTLSILLMTAVAATVGIGVSWRAPGAELYARDWLMRMRGNLSPPDEVVIVAIDEASIARLGRFPWPRALMARVVERLGQARAKVIALDVLYSEPAAAADDRALAEAIARAGNVVVAAQLAESADEQGQSRIAWLRPLPEIERAAA
ncbi:MAG: CHASE2 domain-containing protein, partial [Blastocatellia bacterium]